MLAAASHASGVTQAKAGAKPSAQPSGLASMKPSTQQRIWTALRIIRRNVDIAGLALAARAPESSTGDYIRLLVRAGYCRIERHGGRTPGNMTTYRLVRNSGPQAPRRAITVMADPNSGEAFALPARWRTGRRAQGHPAFVLVETQS